MGTLTNLYKRTPFWEGVASTFDLFGVLGLSIDDVKKITSEERRYNAIKENFDLVRKDLRSKLEEYERESR
jgi:hypothetical protein